MADAADLCRRIAAPGSATGCPIEARKLSLDYVKSKRLFRGKLAGRTAPCGADQLVTILRRSGRRTVTVGSAPTDTGGAYRFKPKREPKPGSYFVTADEMTIADAVTCDSAKSRTIKLAG